MKNLFRALFLLLPLVPPVLWSADYYVDGVSGNEVSSGKYTVKTSMLTPKDTTCSCKEVFVGK